MPVDRSEDDARIGARVERLRTARGLSQSALAREMAQRGWKWQQATVWTVENGRRSMRLAEAVGLAEVLEARVEELVFDPLDGLVARLRRHDAKAQRDVRRQQAEARDVRLQLEVFGAIDDARHDSPAVLFIEPERLRETFGFAFIGLDWDEELSPILTLIGITNDDLRVLAEMHNRAADAELDAFVGGTSPGLTPEASAYGYGLLTALSRALPRLAEYGAAASTTTPSTPASGDALPRFPQLERSDD